MAEVFPDIDDLVQQGKETFRSEFQEEPNIAVAAPGRVNIIGEHVDYCDGFVMPMALPLITVLVGRRIDGDVSTVISTNDAVDSPKRATIDMPRNGQTLSPGTPKWANYIKGVIAHYKGKAPPAFNAVVLSSVPTGGGLSSSAALEVATYTFLEALTGEITPNVDKALACQKAEHTFAGMPCGIMDQFISVMGKKDNLLLIDCRHKVSRLIPFVADNISVLITNSNVKHELTGSEYPTRRKQCEDAAGFMKKASLRDASLCDVEALKGTNVEDVIIRRAKHVVSEIDRTYKVSEFLEKGDFVSVGKCMVESHNSLSKNFEVSCHELDRLVELALEVEGVLGSRMTGGGFGGCTVTLVYSSSVDNLIKHIKENYSGNPTFYVCKPCDGARIMENEN